MSIAIKNSCKFFNVLLIDKCGKSYRAILKPNVYNSSKRFLRTTCNLEAIISFNLSDIGEGIRDVVVKEWFVKEGDKVKQFDNICEVQSDKASVTITSRYDGIIKKLHHQVEQVAFVGKPLLDIEIEGDDKISSSSSSSSASDSSEDEREIQQKTDSESTAPPILCIPSVRRLAKEYKVDLSEVTPTGKKGRVLKEDVLKYLASKSSPIEVPLSVQSEIKTVFAPRTDRNEFLTPFQKGMVKTMTEALKIPHFLYCDEVPVTKLKVLQQSLKTESEKLGMKISMMPFFIKAASNALQRYPILNALVEENCEKVIYRGAHNIGIAMDTKIGLAVPVIKNVDQLSIMEIAKELNRLMKSGKEGTFSNSDLIGGSFTISNIGVIGGTYASPIILPPQVAIIAIGASKTVPRFDESRNIIAEDIVCVSGAADHRIVDGASMANFINQFKKQIGDPNLLFLNL
ncbi:hypothetical protein Trydic_g18557 [Trypoxylus dichotomus]